ncbi:MAG: hypothetical protein IT260_01200 [Saprospiraceae bacterium]|nr:hypothetical protein [Saprospiraceae bacterium]
MNAQSEEEPYDPCRPAATLPLACATDEHSCTTETEFECSTGYCFEGHIATNAGIPMNGVVDGKNIEIDGLYRITQNVIFLNCTFYMHGAARIEIVPTASSTAEVAFDNCSFFGCGELWYGIDVDAAAASSLHLVFINNKMEDAYKGLVLDEGATNSYTVTDNEFVNNSIGLSNRRQNGSPLNAVIVRNRFYSTGDLADIPLSMLTVPIYFHPMAYAGIEWVRTQVSVGGPGKGAQPSNGNMFSCLRNGIISEASVLNPANNFFTDFANIGRGIQAPGGTLYARYCQFSSAGQVAIDANAANLYATDNRFGGRSHTGISSLQHLNGETVEVKNNIFTISEDSFFYGIVVERSQAADSTKAHTIISGNTLTLSASAKPPICIYVQNPYGVIATDNLIINQNIIDALHTTAGFIGIAATMGASNNIKIKGNIIHSENTVLYASHAIEFTNNSANTSYGHVVRQNSITGVDTVSFQCGVHAQKVYNTEFCENTLDFTRWGLHFLDQNKVDLRENKIHHHVYGLYIGKPDMQGDHRIGKQSGRGNTWSEVSLDPDECTVNSIRIDVDTFGSPQNSEIIVREASTMPYLPPSNKIFPITTPTMWVRYDETAVEDYCMPDNSGHRSPSLAPFEQEVVDGTTTLTSIPLWDLQRKVYTKLLLYPSLRPASSPEETFFNSLSSSVIADLGQVYQETLDALAISDTEQDDYDGYRQSMLDNMTDLYLLDSATDLSNPTALTSTYFSDRLTLLQQVSTDAADEASDESARNTAVSTALAVALATNTAITTSQPWEAARQILNDYQLRRLLGQPLTQAAYEDILDIAEQEVAEYGEAVSDAVLLLFPCDQEQFLNAEEMEEEEERPQGTTKVEETSATGIKVMPNPTTGITEVMLPKGFTGSATVVNAVGSRILSQVILAGSSKLKLDLSQQNTGLYWLILSDASGNIRFTEKIALYR